MGAYWLKCDGTFELLSAGVEWKRLHKYGGLWVHIERASKGKTKNEVQYIVFNSGDTGIYMTAKQVDALIDALRDFQEKGGR